MRILIKYGKQNPYLQNKLSFLKSSYPDHEFLCAEDSEFLNLNQIDILVTNRITNEEIETIDQLKYLIIPFTGVNTLPLDDLKNKGVKVVNSHINARYVAEKAITLALSLLGKVVVLDQNLRKGNWHGSSWESLHEMKCGMIGMGEIGKRIISHLLPFDCQINTLERYKTKTNENYHYFSSIKEVCLHSDLIFVSLPLTSETKQIIDKDILDSMKGKYLINVGRGATIEEEALYDALKNQILKGAGIDVWYTYPQNGSNTYPSSLPFHELENVVMSPHCGGNVLRCRDEEIDGFIKKIADLIENKPINNVINVEREY